MAERAKILANTPDDLSHILRIDMVKEKNVDPASSPLMFTCAP